MQPTYAPKREAPEKYQNSRTFLETLINLWNVYLIPTLSTSTPPAFLVQSSEFELLAYYLAKLGNR